jgi:hypothetical protein
MLIPFGTLAASGAVASDYQLIQTEILGSAVASVTFSSLGTYSSTYKHLQLRIALSPKFNDWMQLRFNGDNSLANYYNHVLRGTGSVVNSFSSGSLDYVMNTGSGASSVVIDILDPFSTSKNKTIRAFGGNTTANVITLSSGAWFSTSSTTSLTIKNDTNYGVGSRFSLYGIKG